MTTILKYSLHFFLLFSFFFLANCKEDDPPVVEEEEEEDTVEMHFYFGADLSYVNQILDHNGIFKDEGAIKDPYQLFADYGANLARFRLWHNPTWTQEVYGEEGTQLYNDLLDVEKAISEAKAQGMEILLDFHYSDTWADPESQDVPEAWKNITDIEVLKDSIYQYTKKTLEYLEGKGLLPEMVQIGNETNCGMMYTEAETGFPNLNVCDGNWGNFGAVVNSAIQAVREVSEDMIIVLHVADPQHVQWWFDNVTTQAGVSDFDVVGFSYYPLWHTAVSMNQLSGAISGFKSRFNKQVMILETAYPWTTEWNDDYNNLFGGSPALSGYPYTNQGQFDLLKDMTQKVIDGGGSGIIYWEPAWITSGMKDQWGTGSAWENCTFFDFEGNAHQGFDYMQYEY